MNHIFIQKSPWPSKFHHFIIGNHYCILPLLEIYYCTLRIKYGNYCTPHPIDIYGSYDKIKYNFCHILLDPEKHRKKLLNFWQNLRRGISGMRNPDFLASFRRCVHKWFHRLKMLKFENRFLLVEEQMLYIFSIDLRLLMLEWAACERRMRKKTS